MYELEYNDQVHRLKTDSVRNNFGVNSPKWTDHWKRINRQDSLNLNIVNDLLKRFSFCGLNKVDKSYSSAVFLVIHHSGGKQLVKYFSKIKKAHKKGCISSHLFSLMQDRVSISKGKKQIYGTQIAYDETQEKHYVLPLKSPCKVDKRRQKINLPPLKTYTDLYEIKWDCSKH
jgi:hypothetical protein